MNRWGILALLLAATAAGADSGGGGEQRMDAFYFPPADPRAGELLPKSVKLLDSLQALPRRVDLWPAEDSSPDPASWPRWQQRDWIFVPVGDVAKPLQRARALAAAGRLKAAARTYALAAAEGDNAAHAAVMGAICEIRQGKTGDAVDLLRRAVSQRGGPKDWQAWVKDMDAIMSRIEKMEVEQ